MALEKLKILVELPQGKLQFNEKEEGGCIAAMFNPSRLSLSTVVRWGEQKAAKCNTPEQQFLGSDPSPLTLELFFDTYDSLEVNKSDVRKYTKQLFALTLAQGAKKRPPVCRLVWKEVFFIGVLTQLDRQYTMFLEDGKPVRATAKCTFMRWKTKEEDSYEQNLPPDNVSKVSLVKPGDTLSSIAAKEYGDSNKWREIANANGIENPLTLSPGKSLVLPAAAQPRKVVGRFGVKV